MWDDAKQMNALALTLATLAALCLAWLALAWTVRQPWFAFREVVVTTPLARASGAHLEAVIREELTGTFFTMNLGRARAALREVPWVRDVALRRQWPDRLEVAVDEHEPLARWNDDALVGTRGEVPIVHRRDELRAGAILQRRAKAHPKISFVWDTVLTGTIGADKLEGVKLKNVKTGEESTLETDGLFIFIGHTPNTQMFKGQLEMSDLGYIKVNDKMETNVPGVYAAGEAADPHFRQVITSAGMGAAAAGL